MALNILMNYILVYVVYNVSSMRENKNKNLSTLHLTFSISCFVFVVLMITKCYVNQMSVP